ncbi:dihydroxyacetone kinase regulator [Streptococcus varani]|uniref:Dihydroxyacetone kinase regulator n=1 Tax=Streptococcus varani TaxID=1608583 RepID=A0A0E4CSU1_9STRE|nr:dihydroxyacetone kinase transcriptional activator DhaS [Streptococcus varani]CQR24942.1 dihydroxyacetone kinase regulator [Streptococcus varani]
MATSIITKKRIAKAFKELLQEMEFDKISIVEIMELAQIRRQTFYNHFLDKYQLLDWIFENDLKEQVADNLDFISGRQLLKELFFYFEEQHDFYVKLFDIKGQNDFFSYFTDYCRIVIQKIFDEYYIEKECHFKEEFIEFHIQYHSHALAEIVKAYVNHRTAMPNPDHLIIEISGRKI